MLSALATISLEGTDYRNVSSFQLHLATHSSGYNRESVKFELRHLPYAYFLARTVGKRFQGYIRSPDSVGYSGDCRHHFCMLLYLMPHYFIPPRK